MEQHYQEELNNDIKEALPEIISNLIELEDSKVSKFLCSECYGDGFDVYWADTDVCTNCGNINDVSNPYIVNIIQASLPKCYSLLINDFQTKLRILSKGQQKHEKHNV